MVFLHLFLEFVVSLRFNSIETFSAKHSTFFESSWVICREDFSRDLKAPVIADRL